MNKTRKIILFSGKLQSGEEDEYETGPKLSCLLLNSGKAWEQWHRSLGYRGQCMESGMSVSDPSLQGSGVCAEEEVGRL